LDQRRLIASEAARLLYLRTIKEYKEAKEIAAASLGLKSLPSNYEVAIELDNLVEKMEGSIRSDRLLKMRKTALKVMQTLKRYKPKLIGSVWRGTARKGSDIDIVIYYDDSMEVLRGLKDFMLVKTENLAYIVDGVPRHSTHIWLDLEDFEVEIVVRLAEEKAEERCEIFGDRKSGVSVEALEKLMRSDPLRRFVPRRRSR
jgi:predicted nucleotidyltransferase